MKTKLILSGISLAASVALYVQMVRWTSLDNIANEMFRRKLLLSNDEIKPKRVLVLSLFSNEMLLKLFKDKNPLYVVRHPDSLLLGGLSLYNYIDSNVVNQRPNFKTVCAIVYADSLEEIGRSYKIKYKNPIHICDGDPNRIFSEKPCDVLFTGFGLNDTTVVTVAHGFNNLAIKKGAKLACVFDFFNTTNANSPVLVDKNNVYFFDYNAHTVKIPEGYDPQKPGSTAKFDYAYIHLSSKLPNERIVRTESENYDITYDKPYMIGFPLGLSAKISYSESGITNYSNADFYWASIDVFQRNSGSPVFNENGNLIGMLKTSDGKDFSDSTSCKIFYLSDGVIIDTSRIVNILKSKNFLNQ
ncbi:MAG: serine protease [Chitinophagales bacterium]|nr:serine protease [Chitinophagales bacterium]